MRLYNKVDKKVLKEKLEKDNRPRTTLSFYKYAHILNPKLFRDHLYVMLDELEVFGRIYISKEGVNGQISVLEENFDAAKIRIGFGRVLKWNPTECCHRG